MDTSLLKFNQRLFLAVYTAFFVFCIYVIWLILQSGAGLRTVQEAAFLDNENKMRRLEIQVENRLDQLKKQLSELCTLRTEPELQEFRANYPQKIRQILEKELSSAEYRLCFSGVLTPPIQLLPFRFDPYVFQQLAHSISCFLVGQKNFSVIGSEHYFNIEDELFSRIAKLQIQPHLNLEQQTIEFSPADLSRLSALGNAPSSFFLRHQTMEMKANPQILGFHIDDLILWEPDRNSVDYLFDLPEDVVGPLRWLLQLVLRTESRFGRIPTVYIDNSGNIPVYREDPRLNLAEQLFPDREYNRGRFFRMRSSDAAVSYIWNWYPTDYGDYEQEKTKTLLGLLPEQVFVGYVNELRMSRSYIVDTITKRVDGLDFGIQVRYGHGSDFIHADSTPDQPDFFANLDQNNVRIFSADQGFFELSSAPDWLQFYFRGDGVFSSNRRPFDFSFQNKSGQLFYASLRVSTFLGGAHVLVYQPALPFLFPYYLQWFFIVLLFLLTLPIYFYIRFRYARRVANSVRSCLEYIEKGAVGEGENLIIYDEMDLLRSAMGRFNHLIRETLFHFDLNLGFQKILNQPHWSFMQYIGEFSNFSATLPLDYQFCFPELTNTVSQGWELLVDIPVAQQQFLREKLRLQGSLKVVFTHRQSSLNELEIGIFYKYFQALLEKAYLEDQYVQSQNLKKDLELGEQVRTALSPQPDILPESLNIYWQTFKARQLNGNFYDIISWENNCHFYLVRLVREGIGAGLIACYLKSFLVANAEAQTVPETLCQEFFAFLKTSEFSDIVAEIIYVNFNVNTLALSFYKTADMGFLVFDGEYHSYSQNHHELISRQLKKGDHFIIYSPEVVPSSVFKSSSEGELYLSKVLFNSDSHEDKIHEDKMVLLQEKFVSSNYVPEFDGMLFAVEIKDEKSTL